eukprot:CAMPEP_0115870254 /NCGR_PEP_ID=MMETSP0287-20121206/22228_1 /TAXON_ID=412157 /ORGANISM="Chrysochromulina rotalis, Strain UIO044" /LENGTH=167 /DNA_ID=CAMNT_0003324963 /DNA_START=74 /DNA_END=576 /DNA_ORIENTATION=+
MCLAGCNFDHNPLQISSCSPNQVLCADSVTRRRHSSARQLASGGVKPVVGPHTPSKPKDDSRVGALQWHSLVRALGGKEGPHIALLYRQGLALDDGPTGGVLHAYENVTAQMLHARPVARLTGPVGVRVSMDEATWQDERDGPTEHAVGGHTAQLQAALAAPSQFLK